MPDCFKLVHARGWCGRHWHRWYRTGSPEGAPVKTVEQRFWEKVEKADGCWLWTGAVASGYGKFFFDGTARYAHRVSYRLHEGPIPDEAFIRHLCNNKLCVNPEHLEPGTPLENSRDAVRAGAVGKKLDWRKAHAVRYRYLMGRHTLDEIAAMYGISRQMVWRIGKGLAWSLKKPPPTSPAP